MAIAASPCTDAGIRKSTVAHPYVRAWAVWLAIFGVLSALLVLLPDGTADPVQAVIGWLIVGMVAAVALTTIVKGLERLLDSDAG